MVYYLKQVYPTFHNLNFNFKVAKTIFHQRQAMFICYPTIYYLTNLALVSYMKLLIEWKYPVYHDSILSPLWVYKKNTIAKVKCSMDNIIYK
jgi:hypothetical protein